jgi:hypothetical protein
VIPRPPPTFSPPGRAAREPLPALAQARAALALLYERVVGADLRELPWPRPPLGWITFANLACAVLVSWAVSPAQSDDMQKALAVNKDGSVDWSKDPRAPTGKEGVCMQTIPEKSWFLFLRLYGRREL